MRPRLSLIRDYRGHPENKRWGVERYRNGFTLRFAGHAAHLWVA